MKRIKNILLALLVIPLFTSGCATVIHGTTQIIPVSTTPPGATITIDNDEGTYKSPCDVVLERKTGHLLKITKDGYQDEQVKIEPVISQIVLGNILVGGFLGLAVDAVTGAINHLTPDVVDITLTPANQD